MVRKVLFVAGEGWYAARMMHLLDAIEGIEAFYVRKENVLDRILEHKPDLVFIDWDYAPEAVQLMRTGEDVRLRGRHIWLLYSGSPYDIHRRAPEVTEYFHKLDHILPELIRLKLRGFLEAKEYWEHQIADAKERGARLVEIIPLIALEFEPPDD